MSNDNRPKFCLRVQADIFLNDREDAVAIAEALQGVAAQIASDTRLPVAIVGEVLERVDPPKTDSSGGEPAARKEGSSPLN